MPSIGKVEPFQLGVDDWEQYTERFKQYFVANAVEDADKKRAVLLTVVGKETYSLLSNLVAPAKPASKSYGELVAILKAHLKPKVLVIAEQFLFHQRRQRENETAAQYMAELRKLADKCQFKDYLEEALRDRFVCGLREELVQCKLLTLEDPVTLQKVYETAQGMEAAQARACELQASSRVSPSGVGTATAVQVVQQKTAKPERNSGCYRCGKSGHSPDYCFYRKQSCRRCGKRGHIAKVCGSKEAHLVEQEFSEQGEEAAGGAAASDQFLFNIKTIKSSKGNITVD